MKIIVDELPFYDADCIFFKHGECNINKEECILTENYEAECPFLKKLDQEI